MCQQGRVLSLAIILAAFSRRIVGWSMADHMRATLVGGGLALALTRRHPPPGRIHPSDHGSQYTALAFGERCRAVGIRRSMGAVGDCFADALRKSFCAPLECALLAREAFHTHAEARAALVAYSACFDNQRRLHSARGYLSPHAYERRYTHQHVVA